MSAAAIFKQHYDVRQEGNCGREHDPHGELRDQNVLHVVHSVEATAKSFDIEASTVEAVLMAGRKQLEHVRYVFGVRRKPDRCIVIV